jgi:Flp pilus assembly protein TadD
LRLRIAPLENLSQDPSLDWEGRIAPFILTTELSGIPHLIAASSDPRANRVLEGYFDLQGDRLAVHATLEDPRQPKTLQVIVRKGPKSAGIVPLLDQIARQINSGAHAFPSPDPAALETFSAAMSSEDPGTRLRLFQTATVQNPKFAPAFLALAESRLAAGDRPGAVEAATQGKAVSTNSIEQTEFDYLAATARQDLPGRERAMQQLVRETPDDVQAIRTLAEIHAAQRRFQDAAHGYEEITRLEPTDPLTYNVLGYMDGYAHDLAGARAAFDKYRSLTNPSDLNPIDSLGEVYFYNGDFANAEKQFLAAHEFLKAAQARLMTGDLSGADGLFDKSLAQQPQRDLERAQWEFLTGRRKQAMARVEKLATAPGDAGAVATAQLSFWHLQTGDRATATQLASAAFAHATSPAVKNLAAICRFLSQSPAGKSQFANINALALMLNHQFGDAVPILETLLGESNPATDAQVRTLLTWAYVENGKTAQAKPLVDLYIIPLPSAEPAFVSLIFPRFLEVRAKALNTDSKLYDQIKGDLPDRF